LGEIPKTGTTVMKRTTRAHPMVQTYRVSRNEQNYMGSMANFEHSTVYLKPHWASAYQRQSYRQAEVVSILQIFTVGYKHILEVSRCCLHHVFKSFYSVYCWNNF